MITLHIAKSLNIELFGNFTVIEKIKYSEKGSENDELIMMETSLSSDRVNSTRYVYGQGRLSKINLDERMTALKEAILQKNAENKAFAEKQKSILASRS